MPEPLKYIYSESLIKGLALEFNKAYPEFDIDKFTNQVLFNGWNDLELKDRMHHVSSVLRNHLPLSYPDALSILLPVSEKYSGLEHMFFPDFVEQFGLEHFDLSMNALEHLTSGSSSEFAIRPFIKQSPAKTMKRMQIWSRSKHDDVRRLASEGCRPRLPWAMALPEYKKDPSQILNIILNLIDDKSLYVRRSVANNLNDISKDNPHIVIKIAEEYLGKSDNIDWVIKHACRGLLKQGNQRTLSLFGYHDAKHVLIKNFKTDEKVILGEKFNFEFELLSKKQTLGKLRIEFIIDFFKANGKTSAKIFKISDGNYTQNSKIITKYFSFKKISTRKYYTGNHSITIVINGVKNITQAFKLIE